MPERMMEDVIGELLAGCAQKNAMAFAAHLRACGMEFERGGGYWADKFYWLVKYAGEYVCFVLINCSENNGEREGWTVWADDSGSDWLAADLADERLKKIAWEHVDFCGNCGGCRDRGSRRVILGRAFDGVCRTPLRFDNPDAKTLECMKKLAEMRKHPKASR